jgi:3-hydroxybutyryl-CoA dehydrogenase
MQIIVLANEQQKAELLAKSKNEKVSIEFVDDYSQFSQKTADALFILRDEIDISKLRSFIVQPVFIHSVVFTLHDLDLPGNVSRINAWPTFLQREIWEVAAKDVDQVKNIFQALGWKYLLVPDEPGFVAARVIAMIINEAYFAFDDDVSSKDQIDVAMRLGTNYPYGPFEWAKKIGLNNIYTLLKRLSEVSKRYTVAPAMENELADTN